MNCRKTEVQKITDELIPYFCYENKGFFLLYLNVKFRFFLSYNKYIRPFCKTITIKTEEFKNEIF